LIVRRVVAPILVLALAVSACNRGDKTEEGKTVTVDVPRSAANQPGVTPMAQRVAVLGFLNKRNGIVRDIPLRPGQAIRIRDAVVRLRACETTAPWENEKLTGAFVQLDVEGTDGQLRRVFSGWLYKESPSLNVIEHPVYDVWPKSCAMTYPAGPAAPAAPAASSNRSSASRSGTAPRAGAPADSGIDTAAPVAPAPAPVSTPPSAADNNAT
jgi:hypothetical protein